MTQEEYIKTHPEQFRDDIDKWLFIEFGIIGGCCSAEKSHEYHIARMVAEKRTDAFIEKAKEAFCKATCNDHPPRSTCTSLGTCKEHDNFVNYMKGE